MLQQTQVKTVIPYWERWIKLFPSVRELAAAEEQRVLKAWEGLGYYRRARNLQKAARLIVTQFAGVFPSTFEDILELPGVGRYTAGAICSIAFGQAVPALDGNVARVLARIHAQDLTERELWDHARALVESVPANPSALNQGLMELGATVCTPRNPACPACPVQTQCSAFLTSRVQEFPRVLEKPKPRQRRFIAVILQNRETVLVRQRDADGINGGLWEFPSFELAGRKSVRSQISEVLGRETELQPFATIRHTITNNRIALTAYRAPHASRSLAKRLRGQWVSLANLHAYPFASAHAKLRLQLMRRAE